MLKRLRTSIAWRLAIWFLLLSFLPIGVMAVFIRRSATEAFLEQAAAHVEVRARLLAAEAATLHDRTELPDLLDAHCGAHEVAFLADDAGRVVARSSSCPLPEPVLAAVAADVVSRVAAGGEGSSRHLPSGRLVGYATVPGSREVAAVVAEGQAVTAPLLGIERAAFLQLALSMVVISLVGGGVIWLLLSPLQQLTDAALAVGAGDLDVHIDPGDAEGEVAALAVAFDQMVDRLRRSYAELEARVEERTRELADLSEAEHRRAEQFRLISEVGQRMVSLLSVEELIQQVVELIQDRFGYYHVGIGLVEGDEVVYHAGAGPLWDNPAYTFKPARLKLGQEGVAGWVAGSGKPLMLPDVTRDPRYVEMAGSDTRSELAVPILAKGETIGLLDVQSDRLDAFDKRDLEVLQSLANQAAIAIDNARLYEQAHQVAVLEERQRVARDLHDSVTQSLYGATLYADAASRLLGSGDATGAAEHLALLRDTTRDALAEMRLLIFELRPPELAAEGLVQTLQARLDAVEGRAGVRTVLDAGGHLDLPTDIEEGLYRIAQEALNNAMRHAHAGSIRVFLAQNLEGVTMEIGDDGIGFDPTTRSGGLGLRSITERAERMGARLTVSSSPGNGTRVRVEVPL